ncbi:discoidin domain-containing protein [Amycolatopsis sp. A133]|uniref:discoidin domain-containing protein n=1 Tax=Amycolatopsis sp. A133 TaxID=3064472 RepID=UPI0027EB92CD|nr:discoidin domain-containing protein [Amycolatopsis sp. A133]MDQ7806878.1 discoidin domain-containing protein [Amycolatopsis sp. A133]
MRRISTFFAALLLLAAAFPGVAHAAAALSSRTHLFYYPWYGGSSTGYRHWAQGGHTPPADVGANFYPVLGAYDSGDFAGAVEQHMRWIEQSGAGVIVYSWWGQGSYEDGLAAGVLEAAARHGIKVAWHLEPYGGRTAASTVADVNYLLGRYGSSPAFYREGGRGAFYVFESLRITDWTALDQVRSSAIVLAQTTDTSKVAHFGGMYTYDAIAGATAPGWREAGAFCEANGLVWAPSVGPGYVDDRAVPGNTTPTLSREGGATYDREWQNALSSGADWVSVTSFNEWHEGSVIEPARSSPPSGSYETFSGAYGTSGAASETAYLDRTRYWAAQLGGPPPAPVNLAQGKAVTASGAQGGYPAGNAVDGNVSSYWESSNNAFPQTLTVDFGAPAAVGRVVLALPPSWGRRTQTIGVNGGGPAQYVFDPATGNTVTIPVSSADRYLRLTFTGNTGWPAGQVSEVAAYAS